MKRAKLGLVSATSRSLALLPLLTLAAPLALSLEPAEARADEPTPGPIGELIEPRRHAMSLQVGAQIKIHDYRTGLKLAGYYSYWLKNYLWLDLGGGVVVHKETDVTFNGGVRWKFGRSGRGARAFVRTSVELAALLEDDNKFAVALRGGGGAGWFSSSTFGATAEASVAMGPAFGGRDGVSFAMAVDIMLGVEFLF